MPQMRGALEQLRLSGLGLRRQRRQRPSLGPAAARPRRARGGRAGPSIVVQATELARRPLAETSGGERQRLLLAQALLGRPRLLLLDEPLISLDPHHQRAVVELTRALQQELGIAVLFSAHELNPLLGALDRVLYLGQRPCRARHGGRGHHRPGAVAPLWIRDRRGAAEGRIFVMSGGHDVERDAHQHDHGEHHVHV